MIVHRNLKGFGSTSATGADCPAGGDWNNWCDCQFASDPTNNGKCKQWRPGAPWTVVGAGLRGIPQGGGISTGGGLIDTVSAIFKSQTSSSAVPVTTTSTNIFGVPSTVAYVGAGVLALGVVAYAYSRSHK